MPQALQKRTLVGVGVEKQHCTQGKAKDRVSYRSNEKGRLE